MKKSGLFLFTAVCCLMLAASNAPCATTPWTLPNSVKIVETSGSGTNTYATIQLALTACGNPTAATPCVIKIMPGTYTATTSSHIVLKPFTYLEGSGQEATVITSTIPLNAQIYEEPGPTQATVEVPNATYTPPASPIPIVRISNLQVKNTSNLLGGAGIMIRLPWVLVEDVTTVASGAGDPNAYDYAGLLVYGLPAKNVVLKNITSSATSTVGPGGPNTLPFWVTDGAQVTAANCKGTAKANGGWAGGFEVNGLNGSIVEIRDSVFEASSTTNEAAGIDGNGYPSVMVDVVGSKIFVHGPGRCRGISTANLVLHSEIQFGADCLEKYGISGSNVVLGTLIDGSYDANKITYSYDVNGNPITYP